MISDIVGWLLLAIMLVFIYILLFGGINDDK